MKLKKGLWIIGIVLAFVIIGNLLAFAIIGNLLPDENNENTIISNVIEEEVPEEVIEIISERTKDLYKVTRVIDGDTIELSSGERGRLICIDTPERGEEGYQEAKDFLSDLVLNQEVILVKDVSEKDRYGRLLRYVYFNEIGIELGLSINYGIVLLGYGKTYRYPPDTALCDEIQEAEEYAKDNNLGIWEETIEEPEDTPTSSDIICGYNHYNCGDFSSCSEVMEVFNYCSSDIHYLDGDDDGIPCESLCG